MELLEILALKMGCEYLSNLRLIPRPNVALRSTGHISSKEWYSPKPVELSLPMCYNLLKHNKQHIFL